MRRTGIRFAEQKWGISAMDRIRWMSPFVVRDPHRQLANGNRGEVGEDSSNPLFNVLQMPGRIEVSDELRSPTGACHSGSKACEIGKRIRLISPQARRWLEDKSRRKADWTALVNEGLKVATECGQENQLIKHSDMLLYQNMGRERDEMMMTTHIDVMLSFISIIITIITNAATHSNMT